ncbi:unnamed protein product [Chondrus crispus]|uniref:Uncharacterized protein n=1 Tax=Chondrus crispus TaxID=2769 RepID=R7QLL3_CHOCR|nr:unnamed protein product [Chondrus crispus]CDF38969.1 unnamed protein product [Chondrus crispus]|eukprot:XP_005718874.1 unnamed protein product [Chondrus crispus]
MLHLSSRGTPVARPPANNARADAPDHAQAARERRRHLRGVQAGRHAHLLRAGHGVRRRRRRRHEHPHGPRHRAHPAKGHRLLRLPPRPPPHPARRRGDRHLGGRLRPRRQAHPLPRPHGRKLPQRPAAARPGLQNRRRHDQGQVGRADPLGVCHRRQLHHRVAALRVWHRSAEWSLRRTCKSIPTGWRINEQRAKYFHHLSFKYWCACPGAFAHIWHFSSDINTLHRCCQS